MLHFLYQLVSNFICLSFSVRQVANTWESVFRVSAVMWFYANIKNITKGSFKNILGPHVNVLFQNQTVKCRFSFCQKSPSQLVTQANFPNTLPPRVDPYPLEYFCYAWLFISTLLYLQVRLWGWLRSSITTGRSLEMEPESLYYRLHNWRG